MPKLINSLQYYANEIQCSSCNLEEMNLTFARNWKECDDVFFNEMQDEFLRLQVALLQFHQLRSKNYRESVKWKMER